MTSSVQKVIGDFLSGCNINQSQKFKITSSLILKKAFTSKTASVHDNYEYLEFRGDKLLNYVSSLYIRHKFPSVNSVDWLVKMKNNIIKEGGLIKISKSVGFDKILLTKAVGADREKELEDIVEALCGVVAEEFSRREAVRIAYSMVVYSINTANIQPTLDITTQFSYQERLKEIFDQEGWGSKIGRDTRGIGLVMRGKEYVIEGYPQGTKSIVGRGWTMEEACKDAFLSLVGMGVIPKNKDPFSSYRRGCSVDGGCVEMPRDFVKDFTLAFPKSKGLIDKHNSRELHRCFVTGTFSTTYNNSNLLFVGESLTNLLISEYIVEKTRITSQYSITRIVQSISKSHLSNFIRNSGMTEYIKDGRVAEDDLVVVKYSDKVCNDVFRAVISTLSMICDERRGFGTGIELVYDIFRDYLNTEKVSLTAELDPASVFEKIKGLYGCHPSGYETYKVGERFGMGHTYKFMCNNKRIMYKVEGCSKKVAKGIVFARLLKDIGVVEYTTKTLVLPAGTTIERL